MSTITIEDLDCTLDTHSSYTVTINSTKINTLVTHTPSIVDQFIAEILHSHRKKLDRLVIGLDVEWRPNRSKYIQNPAATLQLCVGRKCLIFQLIHAAGVPKSLVEFLNNPVLRFVGVKIEQDAEKLWLDYELRVGNPIDLRPLAAVKFGNDELKTAGLKTLASKVLGMEILKPKSVSCSTWDAEWLTDDQIQYACVDAFLSAEIGYAVVEGPIQERRLPCCGIGIGWLMFLLGFFLAIPWYVGAAIIIFGRVDHREKPGYVACTIAVVLVTIVVVVSDVSKEVHDM